jgi:microcystin degradation protein MlrC
MSTRQCIFILGLIVFLGMGFGLTGCGGDGQDESAESVSSDSVAKGQKKAFVGGISTETNLFCPFPTDLDDFNKTKEGLPQFTKNAKEAGWDLAYGLIAKARPAGITTRSAYEILKAEMLSDLKAAMPVDMVVLILHGAMVAQGYDDCEGDLLQACRDIVGPVFRFN